MANYKPVPKMYKGKDTNKMSETEYNKMLKELPGYQEESKVLPKGNIKEPDMGSSVKKMAKGGSVPAKGKVVKSGSKAAKTGKTPLLVIAVKPKMAKGGSVKQFKPCATCKSPAKCAKANQCLAKAPKK